MRDTSLDEFLGEDGESDADAGSDVDDGEDADAKLDADDEDDDAMTGAEGGDGRTDDGAPQGAEDAPRQAAATESRSGVEPTPETGSDAAPAVEPDGAAANEISVEPAVATYGWTPCGAECQECEETVERRWLDEDGLVCANCKVW